MRASAERAQFSIHQWELTGSTLLTVAAPSISYITVIPVELTLGIGIDQQFTATATYSDGSSQDLVSGVTWTSSSTSVATVDNTGLATTAGAGQATLTATFGSFSDTTTLTVVPANLISIAVTPATSSVAQGTAQQFTAVGTFDDGSTQLLTSVTWSSSATNVASINASGMAAAVGTGQATITAVSGSVTGTASLTVTGASLVSIRRNARERQHGDRHNAAVHGDRDLQRQQHAGRNGLGAVEFLQPSSRFLRGAQIKPRLTSLALSKHRRRLPNKSRRNYIRQGIWAPWVST